MLDLQALLSRWRVKSLKTRLMLLSLVMLPLLLGVSGIALDQTFTRSLLTSESERLKVQVYLVLGAVDFQDQTLKMPESLTEPRYAQPDSGLYAILAAADGTVMWRSESSLPLAWSPTLVTDAALSPGESRFAPIRLQKRSLFLYQLAVIWEHLGGAETPFVINILEDQAPLRSEIHAYRLYLWLALGAICAAWFAMLWVLVRWGLSPLDQLTTEIEAIEEGRQEQLEHVYPLEVQRLTRRLNQLIRAERQQRERYRNTLADLAHSLKTPLAVVRGMLARDPAADTTRQSPDEAQSSSLEVQQEIASQVSRMDQIVAYQLQRAVLAADQRLLQSIPLKPLLERLLSSLSKVYRERGIAVQVEGSAGARVLGDERDLMELFGNILDNAFKYGRRQVAVVIEAGTSNASAVAVAVEDDGAGIPEEAWDVVRKRGVRADQMQAGQGIGLAVAADIVSGYQGRLTLGRSRWGGARIEIQFAGS